MSGVKHATITDPRGNKVECYGTLEENSNFSVVCDDESFDDIWCNADPVTGNAFESWQNVVDRLSDQFESVIIEISAV